MKASQNIQQYLLASPNGFEVSILNYGAILQSIKVPVAESKLEVLLGFEKLSDYLQDSAYIGAIAGRYCNRIADASFELNGENFKLQKNDGKNQLHGGPLGFNQKYWQVVEYVQDENPKIKLLYESHDGEQGFPGNLTCFVTYQILNEYQLVINIEAKCDKSCPVNLTGHAYFNLNGNQDLIENHELQVSAEHYLPITDDCIPTGEMRKVAGSDLDFLHPGSVKNGIDSDDLQIINQKGIDHNFVLTNYDQATRPVAVLYSPESNLEMTLSTNKPGLQVYTGNHLSKPFVAYQGICLEPQYFPDSPNQREFPNCILQPGETYHHRIIYQFNYRNSG